VKYILSLVIFLDKQLLSSWNHYLDLQSDIVCLCIIFR